MKNILVQRLTKHTSEGLWQQPQPTFGGTAQFHPLPLTNTLPAILILLSTDKQRHSSATLLLDIHLGQPHDPLLYCFYIWRNVQLRKNACVQYAYLFIRVIGASWCCGPYEGKK